MFFKSFFCSVTLCTYQPCFPGHYFREPIKSCNNCVGHTVVIISYTQWRSQGGAGGPQSSRQNKRTSKLHKICQFGQLIFGKTIKIVAARSHLLKLKCTQFDFGWGSAPDTAGGAHSAPQGPLVGFYGVLFLREWRREEKRNGKRRGKGVGAGKKETKGKGEGRRRETSRPQLKFLATPLVIKQNLDKCQILRVS